MIQLLKFKINSTTLELSLEDAELLYKDLIKIFGNPQYAPSILFPQISPQIPSKYAPTPIWSCDNKTSVNSTGC